MLERNALGPWARVSHSQDGIFRCTRTSQPASCSQKAEISAVSAVRAVSRSVKISQYPRVPCRFLSFHTVDTSISFTWHVREWTFRPTLPAGSERERNCCCSSSSSSSGSFTPHRPPWRRELPARCFSSSSPLLLPCVFPSQAAPVGLWPVNISLASTHDGGVERER